MVALGGQGAATLQAHDAVGRWNDGKKGDGRWMTRREARAFRVAIAVMNQHVVLIARGVLEVQRGGDDAHLACAAAAANLPLYRQLQGPPRSET